VESIKSDLVTINGQQAAVAAAYEASKALTKSRDVNAARAGIQVTLSGSWFRDCSNQIVSIEA
jgi:hypothetical protein